MLKQISLLSNEALRQKVLSAKSRYLKLCKDNSISIGFYYRGNLYVVSDKPDDISLRYYIGSVTKTVTAHLILYLKDKGLIDLNRRISDYLSVPKGDYPTVYELLTHTAGYRHITPLEITLPGFLRSRLGKKNIYEKCSSDTVLKCLSKRNKKTRLREKYTYSDFSYAALALVAESVTNKPFVEILESFVYNSLGLTSTAIPSNEVTHIPNPSKNKQSQSFWKWHRENPYIAGGGLVSTISDMLNYLAIEIESNEPFITEAHKVCRATLSDKRSTACCIGWHTYNKSNVLWHVGGVGAFRASVLFNKKRKFGVAVLGNSKGSRSANVHYIAKMLYGEMKINKIDFSRILL